MTQVHVDPEKLRAFAKQLKDFEKVVSSSVDNLKSNMGRLQESWRDQEYEKFARHFASIHKLLKGFIEETKRTTPLLEKDASIIEEYQRYTL